MLAAHFGTFRVAGASNLATSFANEYLSYEEQTTSWLRTSKRSLYESTVDEKMDRAHEIEKKGAGQHGNLQRSCEMLCTT